MQELTHIPQFFLAFPVLSATESIQEWSMGVLSSRTDSGGLFLLKFFPNYFDETEHLAPFVLEHVLIIISPLNLVADLSFQIQRNCRAKDYAYLIAFQQSKSQISICKQFCRSASSVAKNC